MPRVYNKTTVNILTYLSQKDGSPLKNFKAACAPQLSDKDFYNYLFRLQKQGLFKNKMIL